MSSQTGSWFPILLQCLRANVEGQQGQVVLGAIHVSFRSRLHQISETVCPTPVPYVALPAQDQWLCDSHRWLRGSRHFQAGGGGGPAFGVEGEAGTVRPGKYKACHGDQAVLGEDFH